jgi:hypothetical protein
VENFVFAEELELSVVEHRLITLFELMEKHGVKVFYPALIFNETFWLLPIHKRISIIEHSQKDWIDDHPIHDAMFHIDPFYIDLIKSIRLTYFSYTRIRFEQLLEIFKTKNKYTINSFVSFSNYNNIQNILNELVLRSEDFKYFPTHSKILLGKIFAIDFYAHYKNKKNYKYLILTYNFSFDLWESFFESLDKISSSKDEDLTKNVEFLIIFLSKCGYQQFHKNLENYKALSKTIESGIIAHDYLSIEDISPTKKYDHIIFDEILSVAPTEILIKYEREYYHRFGRLVYTDRQDEKTALDQITIIQSQITSEIEPQLIDNVYYELIWQNYTNPQLIDFIEKCVTIFERDMFTLSIIGLHLTTLMIKHLKHDGKLQILDYYNDRPSNLLYNDKYGLLRFIVNSNHYLSILSSFSDIQANYQLKSIDDLLKEEILENKEEVFYLGDLIHFLLEDHKLFKEFFDEKKFTFYDKITAISKKYKPYYFLRSKKILTFGLGTLLYHIGYKKFYREFKTTAKLDLLSNVPEAKIYESYSKEIIVDMVPVCITKFKDNEDLIISFNKDSKINEHIKKILQESYMKIDEFFDFLHKHQDKILETIKKTQSQPYRNYKILITTNVQTQ